VNLGNISFNAEDQQLLRDANKERGAARRGVGIAADTSKAEQFKLDQKFNQDARYVQAARRQLEQLRRRLGDDGRRRGHGQGRR